MKKSYISNREAPTMQQVIQQSLGLAYSNPDPPNPKPKKRVRFSETVWVKFYSVYAFNESKFHDICDAFEKHKWLKLYKYPELRIHELTNCTSKDKVLFLNLSYALDEEGQKQHLGDEKHIYRYKTLNKIKELIANYIDYHYTEELPQSEYFTLYIEKYTDDYYTYRGTQYKGENFVIAEVEINNTWQLSIKQRLLIHIKALRLLRQGHSIEEACKRASAITKGGTQ